MDLSVLGIAVASKRDAGTLVQYLFCLPEGREDEVLFSLLRNMLIGSELSFADPTNGDCDLEAKRSGSGYEIKRGCHGAYGTWRTATLEEVHAWLLPGTLAAQRRARPGCGAMLVVPKCGK